MTRESQIPTGRKPRRGIGCLPILLLGIAFSLGVVGLLAPWNFYFGGHFHLIPGWQGWGRLHSTTAGGDYFMWIRLKPTTPKYRASPIKGLAYLCTPRGERFRLGFGGDMPRDHGTDLSGVPLHFYFANRTSYLSTSSHFLRMDLYGSFRGSELIMEDRGSLGNSFNADGTPIEHISPNRPLSTENIQVTFKESTPWTISPDCPKSLP